MNQGQFLEKAGRGQYLKRAARMGRGSRIKANMKSINKGQGQLVVPVSVQRRAGIKSSDRVQFKASRRTITTTAVEEPRYKPTKAELAAIRKGEAQITRGRFVALPELLHEMDSPRRGSGAKATRKVSR